MGRDRTNASFGLVEEKEAEMNFFLLRLSDSASDPFAFRCYFSAFVSAAMSVLYALEAARKRIDPRFSSWYGPRRKRLTQEDRIAGYVLARRHEAIHIGETRVNSGHVSEEGSSPAFEYFFALGSQHAEPIEVDVFTACEHTHDEISALVQEVQDDFPHVSPSYFMDAEILKKEGLTVEDIEERLGLPRGWTFVEGCTDQHRLDALRSAL